MKVAIVANIKKEGVRSHIPRFIEELQNVGIEAILEEKLIPLFGDRYVYASLETLFSGIDMIVSFGGDGTILHTARISSGAGIPILGINLGKVGFLAEISPEEIGVVPTRLRNGEYELLNRMACCIAVSGRDRYFALNDVVIDRNADTRILSLSVTVDADFAGEMTADGLIISTPTGSTAHSMAAGGPLVMPDCGVFVLTPICPHSLAMRPIIIEASHAITLIITDGCGRMAVDGQSFVDVDAGSKITITKQEKPVRIARFPDKTYFDILHTRLRWGVSLKLKNA